MVIIDILPTPLGVGIPRIASWSFCFIATASALKGDSVLCSLHRLTPQALRFLKSKPTNSMCHSRMFTIAHRAFPGLPIFLRRQFNWTSLVRLSDPCVSGGSTTTAIIPIQRISVLSQISHSFLDHPLIAEIGDCRFHSGVDLFTRLLYLPALKATGFLGGF
jgi:hypothetical protein